MDVSVLAPLLAFGGTVVTAGSVAVVAGITHRSETKQAAETTMERTLRERIILRDEQIADLKADLFQALEDNRHKDEVIRELRLKKASNPQERRRER